MLMNCKEMSLGENDSLYPFYDFSDIENTDYVSSTTTNITHDTINESSENGDDSENNADEDMQEIAESQENTYKMISSTNYMYNIDIRKISRTFANKEEATEFCNVMQNKRKLKSFIKKM